MRGIVLARHGSTALNEAHRFQGHSDPPLSEKGRRQARSLREKLAGVAPDAGPIWTSDLRRARQTAALALPRRPRREDPRLRELDFGAFEGATYRENRARHGDAFADWIRAPARTAPPGGESLCGFHRRVRSWIEEAESDPEPLAVTHGGTIRMILSILTGTSFDRFRRWTIAPGTVIRLERERDLWRVAPRPDARTPSHREEVNRQTETSRRTPTDLQEESP